VNVRINSQERANVLTVPRGAVASEGLQRFVYVVKRNEFGKTNLERRPIHVGIADASDYEVTSGLQENEIVALPGDTDLKNGMAVKVMTTDTSRVKGRADAN
jgi:multidrug efflux pump subunit AcrA (membrane-fusion protein)